MRRNFHNNLAWNLAVEQTNKNEIKIKTII